MSCKSIYVGSLPHRTTTGTNSGHKEASTGSLPDLPRDDGETGQSADGSGTGDRGAGGSGAGDRGADGSRVGDRDGYEYRMSRCCSCQPPWLWQRAVEG